MPAEGIDLLPKSSLLSWEEMLRLCLIFTQNGVTKIKITGGEPFVRKGLIDFLSKLKELNPKLDIGITTNGILLDSHLDILKQIGITSLNISLDSLSPDVFFQITRRDFFYETWNAITHALDANFNLKLNVVIQPGLNDHEICDFAALTQNLPLTIRFIEPMPFSGSSYDNHIAFSYLNILSELNSKYELIPSIEQNESVASQFQIPGHIGSIGVINAFSRTFCSTCSRIRLSALGQLKTCLYGEDVLDLRKMIRSGSSDEQMLSAIKVVLNQRYKDGYEAEKHRQSHPFESMSTIGG